MEHNSRIHLIEAELNKCEQEYMAARKELERVQIAFVAAKEKFKSIKALAADMLTQDEWIKWQQRHVSTRFAAMSMGDAIVQVLRMEAILAARQSLDNPTVKFDPYASVEQIKAWLEQGGFEFQTMTPGREINAALMRQKDIIKSDTGDYAISNAGAMLERLKLLKQKMAKREE